MPATLEAMKVGDLKNGEMKVLNVGGREILVAKVQDKFFAVDNRCPHMGGKLAEGKLEGTVVTCPKHGSQFDLTDGRVIRWTEWTGVVSAVAKIIRSPRPIATYPVKVEGDKVIVEV